MSRRLDPPRTARTRRRSAADGGGRLRPLARSSCRTSWRIVAPLDVESGTAAFEDRLVDRAWRDAVASPQRRPRPGVVRQPEATINDRPRVDALPTGAEPVLDDDVIQMHLAQQ